MKASSRVKKKVKKTNGRTVDDFIEQQLSRYIRIHKKHAKEISYIG